MPTAQLKKPRQWQALHRPGHAARAGHSGWPV